MPQERKKPETTITVTSGPSAQEWRVFKPTICGLYSKMRMKDLQKTMQSKYGFVASKRMYDIRFRKWGVAKYVKYNNVERPPKRNRHHSGPLGLSSTVIQRTQSQHQGNESLVGVFGHVPAEENVMASTRPMLLTDTTTLSMERLLSSVKYFCSITVSFEKTNQVGSTLYNPDSNLRAVERAWCSLKTSLYLLKLGDTSGALSGVQEFMSLPVSKTLHESVDFLAIMVTSLGADSPALVLYNSVRLKVLGRVRRMAEQNWGHTHPLTVICSALEREKGSFEMATRLITYLRELVTGHNITLEFYLRLQDVATLRRNGYPDTAISRAKQAVDIGEATFGAQSLQVRRAHRYLAHIYIQTGDYDHALELCRMVVGRPTVDSAFRFKDELAVWAIEDLAEIHRLLKQEDASCHWLFAAAGLAADLMGRCMETRHIIQKLLDTARRGRREEDVAEYQTLYARYT